ncbi:MAG: hypothetical protein OHK0029_17720 [Armatimonadaceae bacterium]
MASTPPGSKTGNTTNWSGVPRPRTLSERAFEHFIHFLILYSIAMLFIEVEYVQSSDSLRGPIFFLWSERVVAVIFTAEYLLNWYRARDWHYPLTVPAIVDAIAIVPFWFGFFVPQEQLAWIRTLRVLRLLRFFIYDRDMARYVRALRRSWSLASAALKVMGVLVLTYMFAIYQTEQPAQPEKFTNLSATFYFVITTLTTVGYGDLSPVTLPGRVLTVLMMFAGGIVLASFFAVITTGFVNEMMDEQSLQTAVTEEPAEHHEPVTNTKSG